MKGFGAGQGRQEGFRVCQLEGVWGRARQVGTWKALGVATCQHGRSLRVVQCALDNVCACIHACVCVRACAALNRQQANHY